MSIILLLALIHKIRELQQHLHKSVESKYTYPDRPAVLLVQETLLDMMDSPVIWELPRSVFFTTMVWYARNSPTWWLPSEWYLQFLFSAVVVVVVVVVKWISKLMNHPDMI